MPFLSKAYLGLSKLQREGSIYILEGKNQQTDWQSTATSPSILETTGAGRQPSASSRCGRPARLTHASPAYFPLEDKFPTLSAMSEDLA